MSTTTPKPRRLTKAQEREAELAAANRRAALAEAKLLEAEAALRRRDEADKEVSERMKALEARNVTLTTALKPLYDNTKDWPGWPGADIVLHRKLTWGHLRQARDAYAPKAS